MFTMKNITSGFQKPGIWPVNKLAFSDEDFVAASATEKQTTSSSTLNVSTFLKPQKM